MGLESIANFFTNFVTGILVFYDSIFFSVVKFLLGIYAIIVLADIVLLLYQRGLKSNVRNTMLGMDIPAELTTRKHILRKKWQKVRQLMAGEKESDWKIAVIKADDLIDDLIKRMGYPGDNMGERLDNIPSGQIEHVSELRESHELRNRIVHEEDLKVSREDAEKAISGYENFLSFFEVFD